VLSKSDAEKGVALTIPVGGQARQYNAKASCKQSLWFVAEKPETSTSDVGAAA
jgi:hypothetical protein